MRQTRNASPAIQSPDRTRRAAPCGKAAHFCKGWPAVAIAVAVCTPTTVAATLRQGTTARARFSSRTAASIASISAVSRSTRPSLGPSSLPWSRLGLPPPLPPLKRLEVEREAALKQWRLGVERANYEAQRAERRYRAVDPDNRLVARGLERDWEERLRALETAKIELERREKERPRVISQAERDRLFALGPDLAAVWNAPTTTPRDRKELLRTLIEEVTIRVDRDKAAAHLALRWKGGALNEIELTLPRSRPATVRTDEDTIALLRRLAAHYPDGVIA